MAEVDPDTREGILEQSFSKRDCKRGLAELDTDDAADIISRTARSQRQEKVMSQIEDDEQVSDIRELLNYDENTAGGLMAKELGQSKRRSECPQMPQRNAGASRKRNPCPLHLCGG